MQIGDFLTFYIQPELDINEDFAAVWLIIGYAKLTLWNVELLVGRDNLQWGPGYKNHLLFSPNAAPLDQIRLGYRRAVFTAVDRAVGRAHEGVDLSRPARGAPRPQVRQALRDAA